MTTPKKTPRKQGLSPQRRRSSVARSPKRTPKGKQPVDNNKDDAEEGITGTFRVEAHLVKDEATESLFADPLFLIVAKFSRSCRSYASLEPERR